jgi:RES domain-containing protein
VAKFPWPPPAAELAAVTPDVHTLRAGALVTRIYARGGPHPVRWNEFRAVGPLAGGRFDPHEPDARRGVLYGAPALATAVAEVFQDTRLVDRALDDRWVAGFRFTRAVRLLDLTGDWPTRAGASQAMSSGPRTRAQAWAREIHAAYPKIEGVWYPSSMHGGHPAVALWERAASALPAEPDVDVPLAHAGLMPDLARIASRLGYLLL